MEEESRADIIDIINNEEIVNEEPVKEAVIEPIIEEEEVKPKPKPKARAKAKIKIVKEPVVEVVEVVEEKPKKIDKLKEIAKCPDCNMDMTVHTLKYIHKRRGFCKAEVKPEVVSEKNTRTNSTAKKEDRHRSCCK